MTAIFTLAYLANGHTQHETFATKRAMRKRERQLHRQGIKQTYWRVAAQ